LSAWWACDRRCWLTGWGPIAALLAGEAGCRLAWWASLGAIGERGAAG
jgi:hypothetical protein